MNYVIGEDETTIDSVVEGKKQGSEEEMEKKIKEAV